MHIFIIAIATVLLLVSPVQAGSSGGCKTYEQATALLKNLYGEVLARRGTAQQNLVVEMWENLEKGTSTFLRILPSGCTQPVGSAKNWHVPIIEPVQPGEDGA